MGKLSDDLETLIDESMPFLFEKFGDLSALTEHGCLTVAQCALLVPAILASKKPGDASELAAHYLQLALLDIAHGELSPKHPETLLPYSQYQRMTEAGMYGIHGENLPVPTAGWLVSLEEVERWIQSKEIRIDIAGLKADLLALKTPTAAAPVVAVAPEPPENRRARWLGLFEAEERRQKRGALQRLAITLDMDRSNLSKELDKARTERTEQKRAGNSWTSQLVQDGKRPG